MFTPIDDVCDDCTWDDLRIIRNSALIVAECQHGKVWIVCPSCHFHMVMDTDDRTLICFSCATEMGYPQMFV